MKDFQLIIKDLSKNYGAGNVLLSVNCTYNSGLIHGVVGANGSGKTTFFNCISNNVSYKGEVIFPEDSKFGYLPTELFMYPRITGKEFLQFCFSAKNISVDKKRITVYNEIFELPLDDYAESYSTGMLKKLYLLALILEENDILLLDEPFNGLDVSGVTYITELILHLRDQGKLILISTHIIDHLNSFCDTLSLIERGQIIYIDKQEDFKNIDLMIKKGVEQKMKIIEGLS